MLRDDGKRTNCYTFTSIKIKGDGSGGEATYKSQVNNDEVQWMRIMHKGGHLRFGENENKSMINILTHDVTI